MFALHSLLAKGGLPAKVKQYVDDEHWADLMQVTTFIKDTIDFNPLGIKTGVDTELDTLKHTYDNLPNLLSLYAE